MNLRGPHRGSKEHGKGWGTIKDKKREGKDLYPEKKMKSRWHCKPLKFYVCLKSTM